jgi:hypothetical protein
MEPTHCGVNGDGAAAHAEVASPDTAHNGRRAALEPKSGQDIRADR